MQHIADCTIRSSPRFVHTPCGIGPRASQNPTTILGSEVCGMDAEAFHIRKNIHPIERQNLLEISRDCAGCECTGKILVHGQPYFPFRLLSSCKRTRGVAGLLSTRFGRCGTKGCTQRRLAVDQERTRRIIAILCLSPRNVRQRYRPLAVLAPHQRWLFGSCIFKTLVYYHRPAVFDTEGITPAQLKVTSACGTCAVARQSVIRRCKRPPCLAACTL